jgi:hypothetical protein
MQKRKLKSLPRSGPARFPGIAGDARRLNCSRTHLYLVLAGKRSSTALLNRYNALRAAAA